ncbi:hypothetical protein HID58_079509 [Brassica napus]|uniref:Uncharacterized protein n=1 Tax=Brassica napus TaxID=3708 RepID=A0ABQ7X561_BRANA|nr:hypothetical protein HID58_095663 [Brassica napus]KAH0862298.1 hypothetical protein HID58_079509 [Brassica napus]
MANVSVFLSDFQTGRSSSSVEVRLLRFWETRNVRHDGELMGVDMLLLDSRKYLIKLHLLFISIAASGDHAAGHRECTPACDPHASSESGVGYSLTGFDVTRCNQNYRLSDSSLLIRFSNSTLYQRIPQTVTAVIIYINFLQTVYLRILTVDNVTVDLNTL